MFKFGPSIQYKANLEKSVSYHQGLEIFQCMYVKKDVLPIDTKFINSYQHHIYLHGNFTWNPSNIKFKYDVAQTLNNILTKIDNTVAYLILHFNSGTLQQTYDTLQESKAPLSHLCMENMVGAGKQCGICEDEIRLFAEMFDTNRPSFCFDTQHAFAAGWTEYNNIKYLEFFDDYHLNLKLIHLNDSEMPFGSKKDRHGGVALGEGYIWSMRKTKLLDLIVYCADKNIDCIDEGRDYFTSRQFIEHVLTQGYD